MQDSTALNLLLMEADHQTTDQVLASLKNHLQVDRIRHCRTMQSALALDLEKVDLVLTDLGLPDAQGLEILDLLLARRPDIPIVIITDQCDFNDALEAIRRGAYDYVVKAGDYLFALPLIVEKALVNWRTRRENLQLQLQLTHALEELQVKNKQLEEVVQQLQTSAATDPLTALANRRALTQALEQSFAQCGRYGHDLSCVMIDVDGFKQYNDTCGHQAGDQLLQRLAKVIEANCRRSDVAGRYGGDEFVLLLPQTDMTTARLVARRITDEFERIGQSLVLDNPLVPHLTLSMGLASLRASRSASPEQLVDQADHALYRAKATGKSCLMTFTTTPDRTAAGATSNAHALVP